MKIESPKIIFLHPNKTGGTSVEHTLCKKYLQDIDLNLLIIHKKTDRDIMFGFDRELKLFLQHACLRTYKKLSIPFNKYNTFTTVRNPYTRILSLYFYSGFSRKITFPEFVNQEVPKRLQHNITGGYAKNMFSPQHYYTHLDSFSVNNIIHQENLNEECLEMLDLQIKFYYAKTAISDTFKEPMEAYDSQSKKIVYNLYKEDFDLYGYNK